MDDRVVQRAILLSLGYAAQFSYPLTLQEIWQRLIRVKDIPQSTVDQHVVRLLQKKIIKEMDGFYYLALQPHNVPLRKERQRNADNKLIEANSFVALATRIPWIQGIAITGSVAVSNAKPDDDVDFLIVTEPNRLWLTRLCVIAIALFKRKRRSWGKEEKNSWCFNLWLEDTELAMPSRLRNVYGAHEICQTKWVFYKHQSVVHTYYTVNAWAEKYLSNYYKQIIFAHERSGVVNQSSNSIPFFTTLINKIAYFCQRMYMMGHLTQEKVAYPFAFFHPRDTKGIIYSKWKNILETL